jgi:hypothetical protein
MADQTQVMVQVALDREEILAVVNAINALLYDKLQAVPEGEQRSNLRLTEIIAVGALYTALMSDIAEEAGRETVARIAAEVGLGLRQEAAEGDHE